MCNVSRTAWRAGRPAVLHLIALLIALPLGLACPAAAQPLKGEVSTTIENGYARLLFKFADEIEAQVRLANNVLTINFPRPVDVSIERIAQHAPGYVSAARRDPDGKGIRIALARKVTMNSMAAGERLFVDLLPDTWVGLAPGLPRDVIEELARRAREGERRARAQRALAQQQQAGADPRARDHPADLHALRVRPAGADRRVGGQHAASSSSLTFDAVLRFDLADAKATLPPMVESIDSEADHDAVVVRFNFGARVDVRTFREDNSFVVDVETADRKTARQEGSVPSDELSTLAAELAERAKQRRRAGMQAPQTKPQPPQAKPQPPQAAARSAAAATGAAAAAASSKRRRRRRWPSRQILRRLRSRRPRRRRPPRRKPAPQQSAPPPSAPAAAPAPTAPQAAPAPVRPPRDTAAQETAPPAAGAAVPSAPCSSASARISASRFPFTAPTPAAVFRRADSVWMVFDTDAAIAISALNAEMARSSAAYRRRACATSQLCAFSSNGRSSSASPPTATAGW